ncbi:heavy metal translocating P-type ATPase, partial [Pseudomonas sp. MWU13-2860]
VIAVADRVRAEAPAALRQLAKLGVATVMLSGDNQQVVQAVAAQTGIIEAHGGLLPEDKLERIIRLQSSGKTVAMVGDGVNDAPALADADVSLAMAAGADVAIEAADITLMHGDLMHAVDAIRLSRASLRKIRQNLLFAFIYNVMGIPLAALGMLNPVIAGAAMAMSSVSVVSNS